MNRRRESWIDNIKVIACVLVALGHFVQSMTKSGIIQSTFLTSWFNGTIYFFHVPLFFLCSGFVYQKYSQIDSLKGWSNHVLKKLISLGIPYFTFSILTWLLKTVFSGAVNTDNQGLLQTLFIEPVPPYWFLYVLFLLFLTIPNFSGSVSMIVALVVTVIWKLVACYLGERPGYLLSWYMANAVWFVGGMVLARTRVMEKCQSKKWLLLGCVLGAVFVVVSFFVYEMRETHRFLAFGMGILACSAMVLIMYSVFSDEKAYPAWAFMARYTMPVFLMHTIFAAGWRAVLLKLGVISAAIHVVTGLVIGFAGPMLAAWIMGKVKFLDFFINPGRYIRIGKNKAPVK